MSMPAMDDFLVRALIAGIAVALAAGPLGSFVVWRRLAYFGDTLSHSALLGIVLGLAAGIDLTIAIAAVCAIVALALAALQSQRTFAADTLLGILSHAALAVGLIAATLVAAARTDLMGYLFGDVLAVRGAELPWVVGAAALALAVLIAIWRKLVAVTVHEELARVEGVPVAMIRLAFTLLIALVIAGAFRVVGVILITALMIIPAAAARRLSRTPEQMAIGAAAIGAVSVVGGLGGSLAFDAPAGPAVAACAFLLFVLSMAVPQRG
jgi:zinc transport system permease protein